MTEKKAPVVKKKNESWQGKIITNSEHLQKGGIPRIGDKVAIVGCAETILGNIVSYLGKEE